MRCLLFWRTSAPPLGVTEGRRGPSPRAAPCPSHERALAGPPQPTGTATARGGKSARRGACGRRLAKSVGMDGPGASDRGARPLVLHESGHNAVARRVNTNPDTHRPGRHLDAARLRGPRRPEVRAGVALQLGAGVRDRATAGAGSAARVGVLGVGPGHGFRHARRLAMGPGASARGRALRQPAVRP
jgi:hypothetical protein